MRSVQLHKPLYKEVALNPTCICQFLELATNPLDYLIKQRLGMLKSPCAAAWNTL